jgi:hypothetical protein
MSDEWYDNIGKDYECLFEAKDPIEAQNILEQLEPKINFWLKRRKEGDDDLVHNQDEELSQSYEGKKIAENESITLLVGRVILKAVGDLRLKSDKIPKDKIKNIHRKNADKRNAELYQKDAFTFLFENDNLERYLKFWGFNMDVKYLRRKILEQFNMPNMQQTQDFQNLSITSLESIGKR